ncbi:FadR/GntR family transcriptional regulator [Devosia nitrariae]|uniref:GntR family transcriptional regulator n=1 Tax=Devosia nitrariae TaxID=2071872 RepID=A0ABQ5W9U1_9HYPH|nr:FadR/GntR family transcriptional regulator [Devosia nitrariae]GLQ56401.1 GntR family transcriptional regulator [Devosia nitrariae]
MERTAARRRPRLAQNVVDDLRRQIESGVLPAGAQLPTEPQLEARFEVSRTVVREAITELRAAGLVAPIQGKGIFVTEPSVTAAAPLTPVEIQNIPQTLEMLEFRIAIEAEAAAIAAYRRSALQEEAIRSANQEMARWIELGQPTVEADFAFHMSVATATNNRYFVDSLARFGPRAIPRSQFPTLPGANDKQYLLGVLEEHDRILEAIADQDAEGARLAMRKHLTGSQKRYRRLAR